MNPYSFNTLVTVGATLGGALVGAGATFGTVTWLEKRKERKIKKGFVRLLLCDIDSLWKRYMELIGEGIEKHDEADIFTKSIAVEQDYFSVCDNNSDKILYLDYETARQVVQCYTRAKAHVDTMDSYSESLTSYYTIQSYLLRYPQDPVFLSQKKEIENLLKEAFKFIKKEHIELKEIVSVTKSALERQIKKYKRD